MKAEILSVGTELLLGQIVNTDAQFLSRELSFLGIDVYYHVTVGDNEGRLLKALGEAFERSDVIITTGGLGPTQDDLTKETVAKYFGLKLVEHQPSMDALKSYFSRTGRQITPNNLKQAFFPEGATVLPNERGTAPGCVVERSGKAVIILPGPPHELTDMYKKQVLPYLKKNQTEAIHSRVLRLFGIGESACESQLADLMQGSNPTLAPYAGYGEVTLRLTVKCALSDDPKRMLDPLEAEIRSRVGQYVYGTGDEPLKTVVADKLMRTNTTIGVAESITGGMLAEQLIEQPGMSLCFLEGCVAYSDEAKVRTLGVRVDTIRKHGAVSEQTAIEMARGIRSRCGADIGLSTTGIAGPSGGTTKKKVGLVYIGVCSKAGESVVQLNLTGDRERIRNMAALHAMNQINKSLSSLSEHGGA